MIKEAIIEFFLSNKVKRYTVQMESTKIKNLGIAFEKKLDQPIKNSEVTLTLAFNANPSLF